MTVARTSSQGCSWNTTSERFAPARTAGRRSHPNPHKIPSRTVEHKKQGHTSNEMSPNSTTTLENNTQNFLPTDTTLDTTMQTKNTTRILRAALTAVLRDSKPGFPIQGWTGQDDHQLRNVLGDILISSDKNWKEDTLKLIDTIWSKEVDASPTFDIDNCSVAGNVRGTDLSLWKGDITQLTSTSGLAIVNAANDQGLGCFAPNHRCIDNVIHRRAGPRLRMECHSLMEQRGTNLATGTLPIVTSAYHLPSSYVIHITGPQVKQQGFATRKDRHDLARTYELALDAAADADGIESIAIPCISTGLFGFPQEDAAEIALGTTMKWLESNPGKLRRVVFNVFTTEDYEIYAHAIANAKFSDVNPTPMVIEDSEASSRQQTIDLAKAWIDDADSVLICAGAGMSVKEGEMVYTNPQDFARAYPFFPKWGYNTCYETMGLEGDRSVPRNAKWALYAKHMHNMRWGFTPNDGYQELLNLVNKKDHFVLTSNVDACFERSGFDPEKIYTPQGEWTYVQCTKPCRHDSVFESRPYIDKILPHIDNEGFIPKDMIPKCPRCGSDMFGNVRGGGWFLHEKYEKQNGALQDWMQEQIATGKKVVVIEIGAGFNTPTVTRFPMESFARELGPAGRFIRINPTEAEVPEALNAIAIPEGWQVLHDIASSHGIPSTDAVEEKEKENRKAMIDADLMVPNSAVVQYRRYFGHFDWRAFLHQLRD